MWIVLDTQTEKHFVAHISSHLHEYPLIVKSSISLPFSSMKAKVVAMSSFCIEYFRTVCTVKLYALMGPHMIIVVGSCIESLSALLTIVSVTPSVYLHVLIQVPLDE